MSTQYEGGGRGGRGGGARDLRATSPCAAPRRASETEARDGRSGGLRPGGTASGKCAMTIGMRVCGRSILNADNTDSITALARACTG